MTMNASTQVVDRVSASQEHALGTLFEEPPVANVGHARSGMGRRVWIYVYNDSGGDLTEGMVCVRKAATATYNIRKSPVTASAGQVVGIVGPTTIPNGYYGWLVREGMCEVLAGTGTIDANEGIYCDGTDIGTAREAGGITAGVFGWSTEDADAAAKATCFVNCQG